MKKIFSVFVILSLLIVFQTANSQTKFGLGFITGETIGMGAASVPALGPTAFINLSKSIQVGAQLGFITGSQSGDKKQFNSANVMMITPYGKFVFAKLSSFEPFFKVSFSIVSYSVTTKGFDGKDATATTNNNSLWGTVGFNYGLGKGVTIFGQIRVVDMGLSGDVKTTYFGLGAPAVGIDFEL